MRGLKQGIAMGVALLLLVTLLGVGGVTAGVSPGEETLYGVLYGSLLGEAEVISLRGLGEAPNTEEVEEVYSYLLATRAELFFVGRGYTLGMEGERVVYLRPTYLFSGEARREAEERMEAAAEAFLSTLPPRQGTREGAEVLHDAMIEAFEYDYTHSVYSPYEMLMGGSGVCQAYSLLFSYLGERLGLECECVPCFPREHQWNRVKGEDGWYHVDLTWDEVESVGEQVSHTYFWLSESEMEEKHGKVIGNSEK